MKLPFRTEPVWELELNPSFWEDVCAVQWYLRIDWTGYNKHLSSYQSVERRNVSKEFFLFSRNVKSCCDCLAARAMEKLSFDTHTYIWL